MGDGVGDGIYDDNVAKYRKECRAKQSQANEKQMHPR